eukprot:UN12580
MPEGLYIVTAGHIQTGTDILYNIVRLWTILIDPSAYFGWDVDINTIKSLKEQKTTVISMQHGANFFKKRYITRPDVPDIST